MYYRYCKNKIYKNKRDENIKKLVKRKGMCRTIIWKKIKMYNKNSSKEKKPTFQMDDKCKKTR